MFSEVWRESGKQANPKSSINIFIALTPTPSPGHMNAMFINRWRSSLGDCTRSQKFFDSADPGKVQQAVPTERPVRNTRPKSGTGDLNPDLVSELQAISYAFHRAVHADRNTIQVDVLNPLG
jgi:hypothetical protein